MLSKRVMLFAGALAIGLILLATGNRRDWIVYNDSPSIPVGFYVRVDAGPATGSFVTLRANEVARSYATLRGFTGPQDRFIKRIAASRGVEVCAKGSHVSVGGLRLVRLRQDRNGHALPTWDGCAVLRDGEFFVLGDTSDSFDSRYFGVVRRENIEGVWRQL